MTKQHGWKHTFNAILKKHNRYTADGGKVCSYATQKQRHDVLLQGFRDLRQMGYKFNTVHAFRGKHIEQLINKWIKDELSPTTVQNRLSIFRIFAQWIGKEGMVMSSERYSTSEYPIKRSLVNDTSRSWSTQGVDSGERIKTLKNAENRLGDVLLLQRLFGLRSKESLLLRPHLADKGTTLAISHGTKGGRDRFVPIETPEQRQLLDDIKSYVGKNESLVPREYTYAQYRNKYYYLLRKHGICREEGLTPHGLRYEHLNELYEKATGEKTPLEGGTLAQTDKELDSFGRNLVAERAGHSRESIASAYIGGKQPSKT